MALEVEIDKYSGFCGGVIRAISRAERFLAASPGRRLYSLGAIVHNEAELKRLGEKGLVTVTLEDLRGIENPESVCVDHKHSCIRVGDDYGSTSYLYRFDFTGLDDAILSNETN